MKTPKNKSLAVQTAEAFPKEIGALIIAWQKKCADAAADQIALTNDARKIGLLVSEWSGGQITFGFYQEHKSELPKLATFAMLKTFSSIASKLPEAAIKLDDVRRAWQMNFEAAGLLQIPERQPQIASQRTRFMELVNTIGRLRAVIVEWLRDDPLENWDEDRRANVKEQMKPLIEFYEKL
jgi:hypothetical protein